MRSCSVSIGGEEVARIGAGILALLAVEASDTGAVAERLIERTLNYRIFPDQAGRLNRSLIEAGGALMLVSQFTLAADTRKGLRPSFAPAAPPEAAEPIYEHALRHARGLHAEVQAGRFGADMQVALVNDGPLTFLLEVA